MTVPPGEENVPFGEIQGYADGVPAYSNGNDSHFSGVRNFNDRIFTGFQWQCVEFARRWLLQRKGLLLRDIDWAANIFENGEVEDVETGAQVKMIGVRNGGTEKPTKETLLIYPVSKHSPYGHIAVITDVKDDKVFIADQNQHFNKWAEQGYAAVMPIEHTKEGKYILHNEYDEVNPVGWMTFPGIPDRDITAPIKWHTKYEIPTYPSMSLVRKTVTPTAATYNWLDINEPCEKKFVESFGMDLNRSRLNEECANYYMGNMELMLTCVAAGNQLHAIFMKETEKVIKSDDLLRLFMIPEIHWPRLRESWKRHQNTISARFDYCLSEDGKKLKCFEYNADSASTILECGRIQSKYAAHIGIDNVGFSSGRSIERCLERAWINTGLKHGTKVHFCIDNDDEEEYTALYVMLAAEKAGMVCKLCKMFDCFRFDKNGRVVDDEGDAVGVVWKTWNWDSAIRDYHLALEERGAVNGVMKCTPSDNVRLCDLVLGDESICVFEPFWKIIPANKAILPMIYKSNPDCPFILPAEYTVTDALKDTGYVSKPIVGMTGQNITIFGKDGNKKVSSSGAFEDRNMVYQEMFELPKRDDYYAILGGWIIGGETAGVGIREDKTIITGLDSPFSAMRFCQSSE
eukprot:Tbor_TRINITY_DN4687_c0_g1::TRINITY_DN4687_c0_g1_i1::g.15009::m.15009/K01460/gsp; glutathionylspermidine amidase/synthetase